jgi:hypothetical protein
MNDEQRIQTMLDALSFADAQGLVLEVDKEAAIDKVITPEIRAQISDIEAEFSQKIAAVNANIAELERTVKSEVLAFGATIKGSALQAVWSKPRVSWDTKALDGYAAGHPEIAQFRKEGEPSVRIVR